MSCPFARRPRMNPGNVATTPLDADTFAASEPLRSVDAEAGALLGISWRQFPGDRRGGKRTSGRPTAPESPSMRVPAGNSRAGEPTGAERDAFSRTAPGRSRLASILGSRRKRHATGPLTRD